MKRIKSLDNFGLNEAVTNDTLMLSPDEIQTVLSSSVKDFSDTEDKRRSAIVKAIESGFAYFGTTEESDIDLKSKIISASSDDETRQQLFDIAQTFATSMKKIRTIEMGEIEPISTQIANILNPK